MHEELPTSLLIQLSSTFPIGTPPCKTEFCSKKMQSKGNQQFKKRNKVACVKNKKHLSNTKTKIASILRRKITKVRGYYLFRKILRNRTQTHTDIHALIYISHPENSQKQEHK
jgi:hypothetical protein